MLPEGSYPWYSPDLKMGDHAKSIFNSLSSLQSLPHIPTAVMELQKLLGDKESETSHLAATVRKDPLLAADLLSIYDRQRLMQDNLPKDKQSLQYVIAFVGRRQLSRLVMVASMKQFRLKTKVFNSDEFWDHSFLIASIAEYLWLKYYTPEKKDQVFLAGSLCNIGKLVGAVAWPELTDKVCQETKNSDHQKSWVQAETDIGLYSHCVLGEIGAAFWGFPGFVFEVIKKHHRPKTRVRSELSRLIHVVSFANLLSHYIKGDSFRFNLDDLQNELSYFKIDEEGFEALVQSVKKQVLFT